MDDIADTWVAFIGFPYYATRPNPCLSVFRLRVCASVNPQALPKRWRLLRRLLCSHSIPFLNFISLWFWANWLFIEITRWQRNYLSIAILFYFDNSKEGRSHYIDRTEWNQTLELMLLLKKKKKSFQHSSLVVSNFPSELNNSRWNTTMVFFSILKSPEMLLLLSESVSQLVTHMSSA